MTQDIAHKAFSYNSITGKFYWLMNKGTAKIGDEAGHIKDNGYRHVMYDGKYTLCHRLAWLYVHGVLPYEIDHKDTNRDNNAIDNLREVTKHQNHMNRVVQGGYGEVKQRGIVKDKRNGKYKIQLKRQGKLKYIGSAFTLEKAILIRDTYLNKEIK